MHPWLLLQATGRLRKNANYFKVNYLMVVFTVTLITLAFNPTSFIVLGLLAMAWIYLFVVRQSPIVIGGRTFRCLPDAIPALMYDFPAASASGSMCNTLLRPLLLLLMVGWPWTNLTASMLAAAVTGRRLWGWRS